jgi:hypothetical protein
MSSSDDNVVVKKLKELETYAKTYAHALGLPLVNDHDIRTVFDDHNNTEYIIYLTKGNGRMALSLKFTTRKPSVRVGENLYDHTLSIGFLDQYDYKYITLDGLVPGYYNDQQLTSFSLSIAPAIIRMAIIKAHSVL